MAKKKKSKLQSPSGMHDILPKEQRYFREVHRAVQSIAKYYRFGKIDTPIIENVDLFSKSVGQSTDIITKQMYTLKTKGEDILVLRPEGTAPIVRSYIQHGMRTLPQPVKLWYFGPFFRYERPQAGRYRQFWQTGVEVLGDKSSVIDVQVIQIFYEILRKLKLDNLVIEINSIGCSQCRPYYKKLLKNFLRSNSSSLCKDCKVRLKENPLRILDCKEEGCRDIVNSAPQIIDHLCKECHSHFKEVLEFLDELNLPYHLNPYLVRGLDYYTKTVFEIFPGGEDGLPFPKDELGKKIEGEDISNILAKNALGGGGRYDDLAKILGGKDILVFGMAAGVERIVELMKIKDINPRRGKKPKIFLAQLGKRAKVESLKLMEQFRKARIPVLTAFDKDSLKSQLRVADRWGVKYSLILGQREVIDKEIMIRDMKSGKQTSVEISKIIKEVKKRI
jgi:histidyl-tRNA synthetase